MHYRYANHHLEGYTCSSFDSNLGVVKLKLYYFWSWGCFSWIAGWGHLSLTAARFVWSSESSDDCWKCYSETKVGNSWANPTVKGRWVCVLYFVFCSLMTACCLQESAWVQIFNPSPSAVLGFRGRLSCRLYHLVTQWRFWFLGQQSDGQIWKLWSIVSLSEHVSFLFAARSEALMKEVERLSYQHQQQLPPLSPPGFDIPQKKFSKWDLGPQQQHSPLSPTGYELLKQHFSKLDLGAQHQQQQQQLPPLSPTGYELQLQRFSKVDLGSQ